MSSQAVPSDRRCTARWRRDDARTTATFRHWESFSEGRAPSPCATHIGRRRWNEGEGGNNPDALSASALLAQCWLSQLRTGGGHAYLFAVPGVILTSPSRVLGKPRQMKENRGRTNASATRRGKQDEDKQDVVAAVAGGGTTAATSQRPRATTLHAVYPVYMTIKFGCYDLSGYVLSRAGALWRQRDSAREFPFLSS